MGEKKHQNFGAVMAILSAAMFFLLLTAVAWQGNDPDASSWMFIYGYGAGVTAFHRTYILLTAMGALVYFAGALSTFPGMENAVLANEEARESGGLLIACLWMLILSTHHYLQKRDQV